jgi:ABC-type polysaccharide/polyol phosphate export permease
VIEQLLAPFRNRRLLVELARNDFRAKYTGSLFGALWSFVQPLLTIVLYLLFFQVGFRTMPPSHVPFVLWLVVGIAPWFFFTEALTTATGALLEYSYLVKKVRFEVSIVPTIKLLSASFTHSVVWVIVMVIVAASGFPPRLAWLQVPYYFVALFLLASVLARLTSALTPFVRDTTQIVGVALQFTFWLTPVMWTLEQAPEGIARVLAWNPLYYVVGGLREALLEGGWFWAHPVQTLYFWGVVLGLALVGELLFRRLRPHLADVL